MFSFFKTSKSSESQRFDFLGTDMHSHILPGIDDGAPDVETSLQLIRAMQEMGYSRLIATPHIYKELYPNSRESIQNALEVLQSALLKNRINIPVEAAAEYFLDEHFESLLARNELLTMPDQHILIEMSFMAHYPKLHETVFKLNTQGYKPILAHPERYLYLSKDLEQVENIRHYGCKLQVNLLSLSGYYGKATQKFAHQLLEKGWIDFLGTDLHHERHKEALRSMLQDAKLMRKLEACAFMNQNWGLTPAHH